jgi:hypothetical protein
LSPAEGVPEDEGCVGGRRGARRRRDRSLQVLGPAVETGVSLRCAEVEQQFRLLVRRRRLGECSAQEERFGLAGAALSRRARRLDEPRCDPGIARRLGDEQMLRDELARAGLLVEQPGRAPVRLRALRARKLGVDAAADDGVNKCQRQLRLDDVRVRQELGCLGGLRRVELRESCSANEIALLEHGQRARQASGVLRQPAETEMDRATDGAGADSLRVTCGVRGRDDSAFAQCPEELAEEERGASRRIRAGTDEGGIRAFSERCFHELGDGGSRQRTQADDPGERSGGHRREQLGVGARLARTRSDDERDVQLLEARQQEGEIAQRGRVRPVRVVDDETNRTRGGQVGAQPVQAVDDRERRIDSGAVQLGASRRPGKRQQPGRDAGSVVQQFCALRLRRFGQGRLEELTNDAKREVALQLGSARAKGTHAVRRRFGAHGIEQRRLSDPGRPFDDHEAPMPRARVGEGRSDPRELLAPLKQRPGTRGHAHTRRAYNRCAAALKTMGIPRCE